MLNMVPSCHFSLETEGFWGRHPGRHEGATAWLMVPVGADYPVRNGGAGFR